MAVFLVTSRGRRYLSWASSTWSLPSRVLGPLGEDVQDQLGAIDDFQVDPVGDGADLGGVELLVEDDHGGAGVQRRG